MDINEIKTLVDEFQSFESKWKKQNEVLDKLEPLIGWDNVEVLSSLLKNAATPYVEERIKGMITRLIKRKTVGQIEVLNQVTEITVPTEDHLKIEDNSIVEKITDGDTIEHISNSIDPSFIFNIHELNDIDKGHIIEFIKEFNNSFCGISVKTLKAGFSGSNVYMIFPITKISDNNYKIRPKAWIIKVGKKSKLHQEYHNAKEAATRSSSHVPILKEAEFQDRACLIQEIASNSFDEETISFKQVVWPKYKVRTSSQYPNMEYIHNCLKQLHRQMRNWNNEKNYVSKSFTEATKIVNEQINEQRLHDRLFQLGINPLKPFLDNKKFDKEIINPVWYYSELIKRNPIINYCEQPLHGDLHTENIQIDSGNIAHFIDWGNSGIGHDAIDYCALETSIWCHCLPNDYMMKDIDFILEEIPLNQLEDKYNLEKINELIPILRCREVVKLLRNYAKEILDTPKSFHYALGLFTCAVQQIQYEDSNIRAILPLSNVAIRRLEEEWGFVQNKINLGNT